ncbi:TolC family protein [Viridibacterium curvum]|uniref:TolC family protein n=1 Tax=Viridibacterium curvum TaxID=1101404 RepID=A0ABP9Q9K9_9RHOO
MRLLRHLLTAAMVLLLPAAHAAELGSQLQGLLDHARQHSADYAAMRYESAAAEARIAAAGALPDPKLQVELRDLTRMGEQSATLDPSRVGSTRYLLMQDLPWYGKRGLRSDIAGSEARAASLQQRGSWVDLSAAIRQTHIQRYFLARNLQLSREVLDTLRRLEQIAQTRYASGLAMQQDVLRSQLEQTAMRNDIVMLEGEALTLQTRLNALLGRSPDEALADAQDLPALPTPAGRQFADLARRLADSNPQIQTEAARVQAAEQRRALAYRERYPDFTLGVAPIQTRNAIREWELMLQMNIPLQQGARRGQEREATAMQAAAQSRQEAAAQRLGGELAASLTAMEVSARIERELGSSLLPQAELSYRSALAAYENGKLDFATLLEAQRQISQTRIGLLKAQADQQMRWTEITRMLGEAP